MSLCGFDFIFSLVDEIDKHSLWKNRMISFEYSRCTAYAHTSALYLIIIIIFFQQFEYTDTTDFDLNRMHTVCVQCTEYTYINTCTSVMMIFKC